jgi:fructokinase
VKNANSVWLIGRPLQADLQRVLGRELRVANDANCFAASEAIDGAGVGAEVVFAVIIGTGTGAGIVVNRRVLTGSQGIAGEWGHNPMPWPTRTEWPGPPCYCGKTGCIEPFLSGPALVDDIVRGRTPPPGPAAGGAAPPGPPYTAAAIVDLAESGTADAEVVLRRYEQRMARALASVINVLDPDVIVLGGGLSNISRLYENVPQYWDTFVFAAGVRERVRTRLVRAMHGDSSGVRGAARLWGDG